MLSISKKGENKEDIPIATIKDGNLNNYTVFFNTQPKNDENIYKIDNLLDYVNESKIKKTQKYMNNAEYMRIKNIFENKNINDIKTSIDYNNKYDDIYKELSNKINKEYHLNDGTYIPLPLIKKEQVDRIFISGASGVGKSTFIAMYAQQYKKLFKKNNIIMFSRLDDDKSIDDKIKIKRIRLDQELLEFDNNDIIEDLKDSLVIFDDISTIQDKEILNKIKKLRDDILECGRHYNIYSICVSHMITNYKDTRHLILEATAMVFFIMSSQYQIKNFLKNYKGLEKNTIQRIMNLKSRWVMIRNTYPNVLISEHDVIIL